MKVLFLFPPQWMPIAPHFAIATLMGQFEGSPYEASMMDLNIDFYNKIIYRNSYIFIVGRYKEYFLKMRDEILSKIL